MQNEDPAFKMVWKLDDCEVQFVEDDMQLHI